MYPQKINDSLYYVGVNDRITELFERLVPIPKGVTYNSYLLVDEQIALFDTVDSEFATKSIDKVKDILQGRKIDYLIVHHLEPDHTSGIKQYLAVFPDMQIVCSQKASDMLKGFYGITENIRVVADGEELPIGKHNLKFIYAPMVHWPEVMMTYEMTDKTLFSADAFGCFGTLDGGIMDSQIDTRRFFAEMERYYVNIVGKYGVPVQSVLKKASAFEIKTICSLHGPVWQENISKVVDIYDRLSLHQGWEGVVIIYGSMYSHTEEMAEIVACGASTVTKNVIMHDVSKSDMSQIITDAFLYKGLIMGSPTYNGDVFPKVGEAMSKLELRGLKNRIFGCFGSYTWAGQAVRLMTNFAERMKYETVGSVEVKHAVKQGEYDLFFNLGKSVAQKSLCEM